MTKSYIAGKYEELCHRPCLDAGSSSILCRLRSFPQGVPFTMQMSLGVPLNPLKGPYGYDDIARGCSRHDGSVKGARP